jgi:hypothetical protein
MDKSGQPPQLQDNTQWDVTIDIPRQCESMYYNIPLETKEKRILPLTFSVLAAAL